MSFRIFRIAFLLLGLGLQVLATDTLPNSPISPPMLAGDVLIFSHLDTNKVIAVNRGSSELEWFWAAPEGAYIQSAPARFGSIATVVYLEDCNDGTVVGLDCKTGIVLWKTVLPDDAYFFDLKSVDGKLIAWGDSLHRLNPESGKLMWTAKGMSFHGHCERGLICSDDESKRVILVDEATGSTKGTVELPEAEEGWLGGLLLQANSQGIVVYRREKGIVCIGLNSGKVMWSRPSFGEDDRYLVGREDILFIRFDEKTKQSVLEIASLSDGRTRVSQIPARIVAPGNYEYTLLGWHKQSCIIRSGAKIVSLSRKDLSEEWSLDFSDRFQKLPGYLTVKEETWNEGYMHSQHWNFDVISNKLYVGGGGHQMDPAYLWEIDLTKKTFTWDYWVDRMDDMSEGMAYVHLNRWSGFVNGRFRKAFPVETHAYPRGFSEGLAAIQAPFDSKKPSMTRYVNYVGKTVFTVTGNGESFSEGLAPLSIYNRKTKVTKAGFIGKDGKIAIPMTFVKAEPFSEGLAGVCTSSVEMKDDYGDIETWGYIDHSGKMVIPAKYNVASAFENGVAWVHQNGSEIWTTAGPDGWEGGAWLLIDKKGTILKREADEADE